PILAISPGSGQSAYRSVVRPVCTRRHGALPLDCFVAFLTIYRYDSRNSTLEWSILLIDHSNRRYSKHASCNEIYFTSLSLANLPQVVNVMPLRGNAPPKYSQRIQLISDTYQVI
ncbi:hypothetical protein BHE74_00034458, partial [Ensete ventricosum]